MGVSNIFQHGKPMVVFKSTFFIIIFQDSTELWSWITSKVNNL